MHDLSKNLVKVAFVSLSTWFLSLALLIGLVLHCAFDRSFYLQNFKELNTASKVGIESAELVPSIDVLFDYLKDQRKDINLQIHPLKNGAKQAVEPMYNAKEIAHMRDVKALYQKVRIIWFGLIGLGILSLVAALVIAYLQRRALLEDAKQQGFNSQIKLQLRMNRLSTLYAYVFAISLFALSFGLLALYSQHNFEQFWIKFHQAVFNNDLWLLDPRVDRLINLVEGEFFDRLVQYCVSVSAGCLVAVWAVVLASLACLPHYFEKRLFGKNAKQAALHA